MAKDSKRPGKPAGRGGRRLDAPGGPGSSNNRPARPASPLARPGGGRAAGPGPAPTLVPRIEPDRIPGGFMAKPRPGIDPLLLLPMRLEYRLIAARKSVRMRDTRRYAEAYLGLIKKAGPDPDAASAEALAMEIAQLRGQLAAKGAPTITYTAGESAEIWLRWYPDSNFAENGIAPPSDQELALLKDMEAYGGFSRLPHPSAFDDPALAPAYDAFAGIVGRERAAHLVRTRNAVTDPEWERRTGRIAGLPAQVAVFAFSGMDPVEIARGRPIAANSAVASGHVSYSAGGLDELTWLTDFTIAEALGMGVRIRDPDLVTLALESDWLAAVGIAGPANDGKNDGAAELQALMADHVANGGIAFTPAGSATNNSPEAVTSYTAGRSDASGAAYASFAAESGVFQQEGLAADRLAEALGLPANAARMVPGGDDRSANEAAAMIRVIGPILVDDRLDGLSFLDGIDEYDLVECIAADIASEGALPSLRLGDCAYGVVPVTDLASARPPVEIDEAAQGLQGYFAGFETILGPWLEYEAGARTVRIEPEDQDIAEKLPVVLGSYSGPRRLDVTDADDDGDPQGIGCPYVDGSVEERTASSYLLALRELPLDSPALPDADETDRLWPLLYRLARLSRERVTVFELVRAQVSPPPAAGDTPRRRGRSAGDVSRMMQGGGPPAAAARRLRTVSLDAIGIGAHGLEAPDASGTLQRVEHLAKRFADALRVLGGIASREGGTERLEHLLLETIGLFQYRLDAWLSGLSLAHLRRQRAAQDDPGLFLGYAGFITKPRPPEATSRPPEYLQAPSLPQAVSAAIMRSANLRHAANGAFDIKLTPQRLRIAHDLLDYLRQGIALGEVLGLRGERWLRDNGASAQIARLRQEFPILNPDADGKGNSGPAARRLFDGLDFVEAPRPGGVLGSLHDSLSDGLDALADLVIAEAVHNRATGAIDAANAWLEVLSGGTVPGRTQAMRTIRKGHGSDHRVSMLLPQGPAAGVARDPFAIADPALTGLLYQALAAAGRLTLSVTARAAPDGAEVFTWRAPLTELAGPSLPALLFDPQGEIETRVMLHLICRGLLPDPLRTIAREAAEMPVDALLKAPHLAWTFVIPERGESLADFLAGYAHIGELLGNSRVLTPADMAAAAVPEDPLTDEIELQLATGALGDLIRRMQALDTFLDAGLADLRSARRRLLDAVAAEAPSGGPGAQSDAALDDLARALARVQILLPGQRLPLPSIALLVTDLPRVERDLAAYEGVASRRSRDLRSQLRGLQQGASPTLDEVRGAVRTARDALRGAIGREALPVVPRYEHDPATRPLTGAVTGIAEGLGEWLQLRKGLRPLARLEGLFPGAQMHHVAKAATGDDTASPDLRDEAIAPRSYHFGKLVTLPGETIDPAGFCGIVLDEWVELRPSATQDAALAVNYDSPAARAPNAMICCIAPNSDLAEWTEGEAAAMLRRAIRWLQVRALTSVNTPLISAILPGANEIEYRPVRQGEDLPRIPTSLKARGLAPFSEVGGGFHVQAGSLRNGLQAANLHEAGGRTRKRRR